MLDKTPFLQRFKLREYNMACHFGQKAHSVTAVLYFVGVL